MGSGAAPYLATEIKRRIGEDNPAANAMAHAVLGAVTARLNGQSPLAGGLGAGGGELAARVIARQLFPGKAPDALSETEKQQISALSQVAAGIVGGLSTGDAAGGVTGAQAGRNAVENNLLDVVQLEDFAHRAEVGTGEERQKVIQDMVDTNVRQQDEIKEVCATSPQQCQQRYGYLLDEWELFDDTIKRLAKDKSLPDDFRDYMPAVYMSDVEAGGIVAEHGWTKRFEAMGFDADTARVMAATLPAVVGSAGGSKGSKVGGKGFASKRNIPSSKATDRYQPNKDAIGKIAEFLERPGFGNEIKNGSRKTSQQYHGQTVYQADRRIGGYIRKNDKFYMDATHMDHIEVFDSRGEFRYVLNLDGSVNKSKTTAAKGRKLR